MHCQSVCAPPPKGKKFKWFISCVSLCFLKKLNYVSSNSYSFFCEVKFLLPYKMEWKNPYNLANWMLHFSIIDCFSCDAWWLTIWQHNKFSVIDLFAIIFTCLSPSRVSLLLSSVSLCLSSSSLGVWLPMESSSAECWYGPALHGGFLLLIGANSFGHLPGSSLITCSRLQPRWPLSWRTLPHLSTWSGGNGWMFWVFFTLKHPTPSSF